MGKDQTADAGSSQEGSKGMSGFVEGLPLTRVNCFVPMEDHVNDYSRRDGGIHRSGWQGVSFIFHLSVCSP